MSEAVVVLRKILEFEDRNAYSDRAVIGGLDRFLRRWAASLREGIADPALLRRFRTLRLSAPGYASLSPQQRKDWVKRVSEFLELTEEMSSGTRTVDAADSMPASKEQRRTARAGTLQLDSPVSSMRGISTALAARFARLGVRTIRDLMHFYPRRHIDYSRRKSIAELVPGEEQTVVANVWEARAVRLGRGTGAEVTVGDETGNIRAVWFNRPYIAKSMAVNATVVLSGRVSVFKGSRVFESPEWEVVDGGELVHTGRMVPVYPLTQGLWSRQVRRLVKAAVDDYCPVLQDYLPDPVRERCGLLDLRAAVRQAHYPESQPKKDEARERLAFDELFLLQLGVMRKKREWKSSPGAALAADLTDVEHFLGCLPFHLTAAQKKAWQEVQMDLGKATPMCRLLQGDVGSGKTVLATAGLLLAVSAGSQAALMAPTEILAEQHFATICRLAASCGTESPAGGFVRTYSGVLRRPVTMALLTGSAYEKERARLRDLISTGQVDIVLGTHALIQKDIRFSKLGLVVVDEQHRFGVGQRSALRQKGANPHMLVMTATPIPRTLALTLYGDLDLSVIDELPPGRQEVETHWLAPEQRNKAYDFIRQQVLAGHQSFVVCPLIEESGSVEAKAAVAEYQRLSQEVFPTLKLGLLHGRMSGADKDSVMRRFRSGDFDILVSTPVVEVGIDVPNATVMLVEGADRFGLSQLHQFRGRVGRGECRSYCLLVADDPSPAGRERLKVIEQTHDGFVLAEEDLRLRGPGEFFGTRQTGLPDLRMARLSDVRLLDRARSEALRLFSEDPGLEASEHRALMNELVRVWRGQEGEWS